LSGFDRSTQRAEQRGSLEIAPAMRGVFQRAGIASFDDVVALEPTKTDRAVPGRRTYRVELVADERTVPAYVKYTEVSGALRYWLDRLNPRRGDVMRNEWTRLQQLKAAGIPAPEPMAFGQCIDTDGKRRSVVVMAELTGAEQGDFFFHRQQRSLEAQRFRRLKGALIVRIADLARRFHAVGFQHQDFYLCHFWFRPPGRGGDTGGPDDVDDADDLDDPGAYDIWLLDHHRTGRQPLLRRRWIVKDLAQLHFSAEGLFTRTDRVRFLRRYLGRQRLTGADRRLLRAIERKRRRIARHVPRHQYTPAAAPAPAAR